MRFAAEIPQKHCTLHMYVQWPWQVFHAANPVQQVIHSVHTSADYIVCQTNYPKQLLRGLQWLSVVVRDVPRIACPRLDVPQIFALGHRRSSIDTTRMQFVSY